MDIRFRFYAGQLLCALIVFAMVFAILMIGEYGFLPIVLFVGRAVIDAFGPYVAFVMSLTLMLLFLSALAGAFGYYYVRISERILRKYEPEI